jgi:hypothetical protein
MVKKKKKSRLEARKKTPPSVPAKRQLAETAVKRLSVHVMGLNRKTGSQIMGNGLEKDAKYWIWSDCAGQVGSICATLLCLDVNGM